MAICTLCSGYATLLAGVRKRMMLVGHDPSAALLPQSERKPQAVLGVLRELLLGSAAQQGEGVGHVLARGDVQLHDLERSTSCLPLEERRPRLAVGVDPADAF